MSKKILAILLLITTLALSACGTSITAIQPIIHGSGKVTTETRNVVGFTQVTLNGLGNVNVSVSDHESITVEAEDNLMKYITTTLEGARLVISTANDVQINPTRSIHYTVTVRSLDALSLGGSGSIVVDRPQSDQLSLDVTGSGYISATQLAGTRLAASIGGSGSINVIGQMANQTVKVTGSGSYNAGDLKSTTAEVTVSGSGNATIWVASALKADITGSGIVHYFGSPSLTQSILGSGKILRLGTHS